MAAEKRGEIFRVAGPVVTATGIAPRMYDVIRVGTEGLMGEVIKLAGPRTVIQVYEDTTGLRPGEPVIDTGQPLTVELGPGLLASVYDGVQRPLPILRDRMGDFVRRGLSAPGLDRAKRWEFTPTVKPGMKVGPGSVLGEVAEGNITHRILLPPTLSGSVKAAKAGSFTVEEPVVTLDDGKPVPMMQIWPVRQPRPFDAKLMPEIPLITGQRVFDTLFPIAKGGTAAIPGGFGTGKCAVGETPVHLAGGAQVPLCELFSEAHGRREEGPQETMIHLSEPIEVLSLRSGSVRRACATAVYRGRTNALVRVRTRGGREVQVTPVHRLFRARSGAIEEVPAGLLTRGDALAVPTGQGGVATDRVEHISLEQGREEVFDLTVPGPQNFVGGERPMFLHNTVSSQQLSKWSDAQIVVYVGCGERGNEMTEVLTSFPELEDPQTGKPLMGRTVLVANTSNMPVAAREASVYTGITVAEYYRDMGYDVSLMADSTSRWAEAMREISSRLEEMPGEEGFPAYLAARLSEFYERCGRVRTLAGNLGSISVIGAVSPSGGDFSEPVTQNTLRIVKVFWALDSKLRERRHFPSVNWLTSYSLYGPFLEGWYRKHVAQDWPELRGWTMEVLQKEAELQEIVQLVGSDALPEEQRLVLEVARMIREFFLQQSAYHPVDTYSPLQRQYQYLAAIRKFSDLAHKAVLNDVPVERITALPSRLSLGRLKFEETIDKDLPRVTAQMESEFSALGR